jgi:hypothetical protein
VTILFSRSPLDEVNSLICMYVCLHMPITVAVQSKALIVIVLSNAEIVGSNPKQGMDVCTHLFPVYVVLCVCSSIATG